MHEAIKIMLAKYNPVTFNDHENALHEIIQEIALLGLWRSKFYEHTAFYGGTALRILHGLERFSENLDFSLLQPYSDFDLSPYNKSIQNELAAFGLESHVDSKNKSFDSDIKSAFIKTNTRQQLLTIEAPKELINFAARDKTIKIKIEIDTNPPLGFNTEALPLLLPIPFSVKTYQLPDLFAGKLHALLCRAWKKRIKGRDWYDFVWYVSRNISPNLEHLKSRLIQTGHWQAEYRLDINALKKLLTDRINTIDFDLAKQDVMPFIKNLDAINLWSKEFFMSLVDKLTYND